MSRVGKTGGPSFTVPSTIGEAPASVHAALEGAWGPTSGLQSLVRGLRRTVVVGAVLVGLTVNSVAAQGALMGANPGAPKAGASVALVTDSLHAADDVAAAFEVAKASPADQRLEVLLALHLADGKSPSAALNTAMAATTHHLGAPSHAAYLRAERIASSDASIRAEWAGAHLARAAAAEGATVEGLRAELGPLATAPRSSRGDNTGELSSKILDLQVDGALDRGAWVDFRDEVISNPPSHADVEWARVRLETNNGRYFTPAVKARVRALLDHPSAELCKVAADLEQPRISVAGAELLLGEVGRLADGPAAERALLVSTLDAFDFAPQAKLRLQAAIAERPVVDAVQAQLASGSLDAQTWEAALAPNLERLPKTWSEAADLLLEARMDPAFEMTPGARQGVDAFLRSRGYPMQLPLPATAAAVRDANVTAPDFAFEALMTATGRDGGLVMGFVDGGYDLGEPNVLAKRAPNVDEIPGNEIDDDENGYVDDYDGVNLLGLVDGKRDFEGKKQGHLRTGMYRGDAHGNHVVGVGTRGTDRIEAALAVSSAGTIAESFDYLVEQGATVINFSMGVDPRALEETLAAIDRHPEVLFVHSAGNAGRDLTTNPSEFSKIAQHPRPNLVHVAAADEHGARLSDSNYSGDFVHLAAAAKHYSFSVPGMQSNDRFGSGDFYYSGKTSQASPNAGNTAAKVRLLAPKLGPEQVGEVLIRSSAPDARWDDLVVADGLLDHDRALALAGALGLVQDGLGEDAAIAQLDLSPELASFVRATLPGFGL